MSISRSCSIKCKIRKLLLINRMLVKIEHLKYFENLKIFRFCKKNDIFRIFETRKSGPLQKIKIAQYNANVNATQGMRLIDAQNPKGFGWPWADRSNPKPQFHKPQPPPHTSETSPQIRHPPARDVAPDIQHNSQHTVNIQSTHSQHNSQHPRFLNIYIVNASYST